ncbi:MAG: tetratricopeptide repeat protein [Chloroflexi bacterium]|nr:tetratricopeptide repeat protein [Chloroflexota bacterium]
MSRNGLRAALVILFLALAAFVPIIVSGYSELKQADSAGSYSEIASHYLSAAKRIPWRPDLYELAGTAYYHAQDYPNAEAAYQKAFLRGSLSPEGWVAWGDVVYLGNDPERALDIWQDGLAVPNPSIQVYSRLAKVTQERGEYSAAAEYLEKYVSSQPNDASAHYRLGLLLSLSDPAEAIPELLAASRLDPQFDPAVQTLRTALNLASINDSPAEQLVITGRGLGLVNEWGLARAAFEKAVEADEEDAEAWAWLGEADQQTAGDEALSLLDRALSLNPDSPTVRGLRGLYFQRVGNDRDALTEFQAAARLDSENPAWFASLGDSYAKTGDLIRALEAYQYAVTLVPDNAEYWLLLATFCAENNVNIPDAGIPAAQKAVLLSNEDPAALDVLGWALLLNGRYPEAKQILLRALEAAPRHASALFHLGVVYLQTGDRAAAFDHLVRARDLGSVEAEAALKQYFP